MITGHVSIITVIYQYEDGRTVASTQGVFTDDDSAQAKLDSLYDAYLDNGFTGDAVLFDEFIVKHSEKNVTVKAQIHNDSIEIAIQPIR